ncbi:putative membrane protein [Pedobacter sp. UYEF25]
MSGKTIFIIILTVLLTIFLMGNTDAVNFKFLWIDFEMSKLLVIGICVLFGLIIGYILAKPKKTVSSYDRNFDGDDQTENKSELSDEDREYIS